MNASRILLCLTLAVPMGLVACGGSHAPAPSANAGASKAAPAAPSQVDVAGLKSAKDAGQVTLIDVRTPGEYAEGHVPGAVNIPLDQVQARMSELEAYKSQDLYLICRSGARSAKAQGILQSAGFEKTINVAGGTLAWQSAGFPVE
jgi:rhodanese-related sulfurtransferase